MLCSSVKLKSNMLRFDLLDIKIASLGKINISHTLGLVKIHR